MISKRMVVALWLAVLLAGVACGEDAFFTSSGVKLHYTVQGQGEPVILIHGFGSNIRFDWVQSGVLAALAQDYHVIALDNRGHGQSEKPTASQEYGLNLVNDVAALMDHLKIQKTHLVGYSMGGMIAEKLLTVHPERFTTVTLGGAGWTRAENTSGLESLALSLEQGKGLEPLFKLLTPKGEPPNEERIQSLNQIFLSMNDPKALAACIRSLGALTVTEDQLRGNHVPVLVLIGEKDPLKDDVDRLQGLLANITVLVIPNANHGTATSSPVFVSSLKNFLADHPVGYAEAQK